MSIKAGIKSKLKRGGSNGRDLVSGGISGQRREMTAGSHMSARGSEKEGYRFG
jgi:hypothetical protein